MKRWLLGVGLLLANLANAHADIITQWNFNSSNTVASTGTGTASLVGGVTATFASGDASSGSSDPLLGGDQAWNLSGAWNPTGSNLSQGARFDVSTVGFQDVTINWDLRQSNSSSRFSAFEFSANGGNSWTTLTNPSLITIGNASGTPADIGGQVTAGGLMTRNTGDRWLNNNSVNLSSFAAVNNNANFSFRVVAAFDPASNTFVRTDTGASPIVNSGTWRFDMVTVSGVTAVPEPSSIALLSLVGIGSFALRRLRKGRTGL